MTGTDPTAAALQADAQRWRRFAAGRYLSRPVAARCCRHALSHPRTSCMPTPPPATLRTCENCRTALQGGFCHLCGQSGHNPVRHLTHAVEEVFESFWHLDGRIFRTLRDLWWPGRVAAGYLAGHRVQYVAPLRLFVILAALTFFVAQLLVAGQGQPLQLSGGDGTEATIAKISAADAREDVERLRDDALTQLAELRTELAPFPGADAMLVSAQGDIQRAARARLAALGDPAGSDTPDLHAADAAPTPATDAPAAAARQRPTLDNPRLARMTRNAERMFEDRAAAARTLLRAAPMALLITVPLFAVLLKLMYLWRRHLYLEHMVVALYSHAWLLLALLVIFVLQLAGGALSTRVAWAAQPIGWLQNGLLLWMPAYLLWMQQRLYRQSWLATVLKFMVIAPVYLVLVFTVALLVGLYVVYSL